MACELFRWKNGAFAEFERLFQKPGCKLEDWSPAMIPGIGRSFFSVGSASTPNVSNAVAPSRYREFLGANITGQANVSPSSGRVNRASPKGRRSRRSSARMSSRRCLGRMPMACKRSCGIKLYRTPVSTQKFSSKKTFRVFRICDFHQHLKHAHAFHLVLDEGLMFSL